MIRSEFEAPGTRIERLPVGYSYPDRTHQLLKMIESQTDLTPGVALYRLMAACLSGPSGGNAAALSVRGMHWVPRTLDTKKASRTRTLYWPAPMHAIITTCADAKIRPSDLIESVTTSWFLWVNRRPIARRWALPTAYAYAERQRQRGIAVPDLPNYNKFYEQIQTETGRAPDYVDPWTLQVATDPG